MDFTYPANLNIESPSSATTPPPTPQPFNNSNSNIAEDKDSSKEIAPTTSLANTFVEEKDDLFTSFKRTESRKRTLLLQQQQHDIIYPGSYPSENHASSPLKKPVPSRFFGDLASPSSYKPSHKHIYKGQHPHLPKTMGPSLWCSSTCCTGKYHLNVLLNYFLQ